MAKKPAKVRDPDLAEVLRMALERGAFAPAEASRVIRALEGYSQEAFAARLGVNVKVIKALESGSGNPRYDSLQKIAESFGLRVAFVQPATAVELLDPDARAETERRRRLADVEALASGKISIRDLHKRNALDVDAVTFELPSLA
jgi:transcriptional regulator with XRE-family HTH domain